MRTDELIQALARDVRSPAPRLEAQLWAAAALGGILSLLAFALALGPRDDLLTALAAPLFNAKVAVAVILAATAAFALPATARPGSAVRWGWVLPAPALVVLLAVADLLAHPADLWLSRLVGSNAYVCLTAIPLLALAPLLGLLIGLRSGAPTRPAMAGGLAGVLAGALAASLYAFHCADDSPLFVATWYSLAIVIVAGLGAAAGALILRW
jgi:hypothetical protein